MNNIRQRLTITLKKEVVQQIDKVVDGSKIRNRSHAIEYLLTKTFNPKLNKVVILAAGRGVRMRPFTYEMPKGLLPIQGRPLLEHIINLLRTYELRNIYILVGHLKEKIKEYFADGSKFGVKIQYVEQEKKNIGTAGALRNFKNILRPEKDFLFIYGDVLAEINLSDFIEFHQKYSSLATVALTSVDDPSIWGAVKLQGIKAIDFKEKTLQKQPPASHLISAGIYMLNSQIFDYIPDIPKKLSLEKDILPKLIADEKLSGYPFEGAWFDVSTPKIYEQVIKRWGKT